LTVRRALAKRRRCLTRPQRTAAKTGAQAAGVARGGAKLKQKTLKKRRHVGPRASFGR
jgi:hypothetical protein